MVINTTPSPAIATLVPDSEGHGTVLRIVYAHHLDGESLAFQLFHRYVHRLQAGSPLPDEITRSEVMTLLGEQGADCAEGWHSSANEPTEEASAEAWQWVCAQVNRLFPGLSWKVEPDRRMNIPGVDDDKVADIVIRARPLASDVTRPATMFDPALTYYADGTHVVMRRGTERSGRTFGVAEGAAPYAHQAVRWDDVGADLVAPHVLRRAENTPQDGVA
ncbi:hypothetical protein ADK41_01050 [Streptomyces caelestis]|uniref:Uncharacterized protein n=1 Tax=Streptomyces caelestis TaxID=36816 RepID=A0A0M9XBH0_9ACTN|nr:MULTISPECIES: hypothetical protein [Streptomyces]KOT46800.1 hypothetical protein ADK41_01050 [Streptomyces caelestis]